MSDKLDEFMSLYESFFDDISPHAQVEIEEKLDELIDEFREIINKEKY